MHGLGDLAAAAIGETVDCCDDGLGEAFEPRGQALTLAHEIPERHLRALGDDPGDAIHAMVKPQGLQPRDPLDPETRLGVLVSEDHAGHVAAFVERARRQGARLLCGGEWAGSFMLPTVLDCVAPDMEIAQEEVFALCSAI